MTGSMDGTPMDNMTKAYLVRHGPTEWSVSGQHTSTTDLPLLPAGEHEAEALAPRLAKIDFTLVLTSPRLRARRTAELAGFPDAEVDDDLVEWGYGDYEGLTRAQIHRDAPGWSVWEGPTPGGEAAVHVCERLDRVVARVRAQNGPVLVFGHGHALRALAARWLDLPVRYGRIFKLDTATVSVLGDDRGQSVVLRWNS